jgi:hypothetical protein
MRRLMSINNRKLERLIIEQVDALRRQAPSTLATSKNDTAEGLRLAMERADEEMNAIKAMKQPTGLLADVMQMMQERGVLTPEIVAAIKESKNESATAVLNAVETGRLSDITSLSPEYMRLIIQSTKPYGATVFDPVRKSRDFLPILMGLKVNGVMYKAQLYADDTITNIDTISTVKTMRVSTDELRTENLHKMLTFLFTNEVELMVHYNGAFLELADGRNITVGLGDVAKLQVMCDFDTERGGSVNPNWGGHVKLSDIQGSEVLGYVFRLQTIMHGGALNYQAQEGSYTHLRRILEHGDGSEDERQISIV